MAKGDRRAPGGLRLRLTVLSTVLLALVGALLLVLAYLLVERVVAALPRLAPETVVRIGDEITTAGAVTDRVVADGQRTVLIVGLIAFPLQLAAGAFLSWVLIGRALRPLTTLTQQARTISESSLDRRIRIDGPRDEVADLAESFDDMVMRLRDAFDAERRFVANASHELRTPLAVIRTEIDVTLADPHADPAELRRMADIVREQTDRADRLLSALLLLARTQARGVAVHQPVDLAALVPGALNPVLAEAEQRGLTVTVQARRAALVGDPTLLERLLGNLVENAVRHNVSGGWVRIVTRAEGPAVTDGPAVPGAVVVEVSSSGPVIEPSTVVELFEPFRQGIRARTTRGGTGLGLSIVQAVVDAHGGQVAAEPVPGGGLRVRVRLPASPATPPAGAPATGSVTGAGTGQDPGPDAPRTTPLEVQG